MTQSQEKQNFQDEQDFNSNVRLWRSLPAVILFLSWSFLLYKGYLADFDTALFTFFGVAVLGGICAGIGTYCCKEYYFEWRHEPKESSKK